MIALHGILVIALVLALCTLPASLLLIAFYMKVAWF
jgi:hypothetical protein